MFARVDFSKLTLMDALDLASLIEVEAFQRYTLFAAQLGHRDPGDAASVFRSMAANEKKHGDKLARRRQTLFGETPAKVKFDDLFDVELLGDADDFDGEAVGEGGELRRRNAVDLAERDPGFGQRVADGETAGGEGSGLAVGGDSDVHIHRRWRREQRGAGRSQ